MAGKLVHGFSSQQEKGRRQLSTAQESKADNRILITRSEKKKNHSGTESTEETAKIFF